ncbi:ABC transporter ATP-binding protein [Abyssisolibacter fermentans]|uniref:ABC transporter ATP-binding protein n=1 Tax=Abyssisolibacter fermentans TaxID=1766203 RepID=UPI000835A552|nr:ABC transporter ATP-binding protein [Abyssisolibacter fermentans]
MISVENISKKIRNKDILQDISFKLTDGDVLGIVGPNGTGKSTLISIISTVLKPSSGKVSYFIDDKLCTDNLKRNIGYVPQEVALYEELTIKDNFLLFSASSSSNKENIDQAMYIAEKLSLVDNLNTKVSKLSGGTKRRVNIGIALITNPKFILMDEPVVGVDYTVRRDIESIINELSGSGKIVVITSHLIEFLENTCNKLLIIKNGRQEYFGDFNDEVKSKI